MGSPKDYADAMAAKVTYDWYRNRKTKLKFNI